jgi:hypothetical protein
VGAISASRLGHKHVTISFDPPTLQRVINGSGGALSKLSTRCTISVMDPRLGAASYLTWKIMALVRIGVGDPR